MKAKSRYQPSKTVEALFTTAVVKIKADADKAIVEQKAMSETEVVSAKAGVEDKTKEPILEQKVEPEVETEAAIEASAIEPETESFEQTGTNETKSEAEPVSQKETEETLESEADQEVKDEGAEQKTEGADADASEDVAEEKIEVMAESEEPAAGEVSKTIRQMTQSQPNQMRDELRAASDLCADLCAKDVMQRELVWGSPEDSVQQTLTKTQQHNTGYILIGQNGVLEGLVSKSDLAGAVSPYLRPVFAKWRRPLDDATLQIRIKWIMSRPVHTVKPETSLVTVIGNMCQFGQHAFPVVDERGKVQGLVTVFCVFQTLLNSNPNISTTGEVSQAPPLAQIDL